MIENRAAAQNHPEPWALTGGARGLRLWDAQTGDSLATLEGHTDWVYGALALGDDRLLSWSLDGTLRLWDAQTGDSLATLEGHTAGVEGALKLGDGRLLSWSRDNTLRLWDAQTGEGLGVWPKDKIAERILGTDLKTRQFLLGYIRSAQVAARFSFQHFWNVVMERPSRAYAPDADYDLWVVIGGQKITMSYPMKHLEWHQNGDWFVCHLTASGTVVQFCARDLAFLQLHHGNRRVSLAEAEATLAAAD